MSFNYALVARGTTPLAEFAQIQGNFRSIAIKMLENIDPKTPRAVVEQGQYVFMTLSDPDHVTYLCLTDNTVPTDQRISFLDSLKSKWRQRYGNNASQFAANSKDAEFGRSEIAALIRQFNSTSNQKISTIKSNLRDTQDQMTQNLTMALSRGEQLSVMESKAENIKESADTFHRQAKSVRRNMCIEKYKWWFIAALIVIVVIFVIVWIACGAKFQKCGGKKKE